MLFTVVLLKLSDMVSGLSWYAVVDTGEYLVVYQEAFSARIIFSFMKDYRSVSGVVSGIRDTHTSILVLPEITTLIML